MGLSANSVAAVHTAIATTAPLEITNTRSATEGMMIEHEPWIGSLYREGIDGQRLAIVGHSHWGDVDSDQATVMCLSKIVSGEWRIRFFTLIRNYFGFNDHSAFWHRVIFFNYLPTYVGAEDNRYGRGNEDQIARAQQRFLGLLANYLPDKVFVFSNDERAGKGWPTRPRTYEEETGGYVHPLGEEFPRFSWGTYRMNGNIVVAFGLKHPERANGAMMRNAVKQILAMPPMSELDTGIAVARSPD